MDKLLIAVLLLASWPCSVTATEPLSDPMRPMRYLAPAAKGEMVKEKAKTDDWALLAVLTSEGRTVAVINGVSLQKGDDLEGYTLVQIHPGKAVLKNRNRTITLHRAGTGLKKTSSEKDVKKRSKL